MKELDPLIGTTVSGRYRVHTLIGQGGMGKVFQAQQIPLNRAVALKVLEAGRVDAGFHRRFFQEAAILAKLKSRHTVTIYDYGRDGDLYFIAMELVDRRHPRSADGQRGAVHRAACAANRAADLPVAARGAPAGRNPPRPQAGQRRDHPAEDGRRVVKVLDFGLAKRLDRHSIEELATRTPTTTRCPARPSTWRPR